MRRAIFAGVCGLLFLSAVASAQDASKAKGWSGQFQKPSDEQLRQRLTSIQYEVTQRQSTERAYANEYWDNHKPGIYVDIVSGEPLFSSLDKYDSGTGWPSFTKPLEKGDVSKGNDLGGFFGQEVHSTHAHSHLGHVFGDGPPPGGLRYCINSASLRFIAAEKLTEDGYGQYQALFQNSKKK